MPLADEAATPRAEEAVKVVRAVRVIQIQKPELLETRAMEALGVTQGEPKPAMVVTAAMAETAWRLALPVMQVKAVMQQQKARALVDLEIPKVRWAEPRR